MRKIGIFLLCVLVVWVMIDPQAAGAFTRHVLESFGAWVVSLGEAS